MINNGWLCPTCLSCFKQNYRRREKWQIENYDDYEPVSDDYLNDLYKNEIDDTPDENGQYLIPMSYKTKRFSKDGDVIIEHDISHIVTKIRNRR